MATSGSINQQTANNVAQLKNAQSSSVTKANDILQSQAYQDAKNNLVPQSQARDAAEAEFRRVLVDRSTTQAQIAEARANFEAADDRYRGTVRFLTAETAKASGALSEGVTYQREINNTAGVQTTSPPKTLAETTTEAEKTGKEVEEANKNKNVTPPQTLNPVPPVEPYKPALETPVDPEPQGVDDLGSFDPNVPTAPTPPTPDEPTKTTSPILPVQQPQYVFNQSQLDYIESYNNALAESGNSNLQVEANSPEALDVLIENGQIVSDDEGFPESQRTVDEEPSSFREGLRTDEDGNTIYGVNISGVNQPPLEEGDPAIDSQVVENFPEEPQQFVPPQPAREQFAGKPAPDWRFRISLAPTASYLYKDSNPGILAPLARSGGVIFPYTPQITVIYAANYNSTELTHSNYKIHSYRSSSVDSVTITADFTAQDSVEANYLLAVIHFFRSVTKMFYGQDNNPSRGVPPPLCYLTGFGQYQFDHHPVVISNFTYSLPVDVDYVNAYPTNPSTSIGGVDLSPYTVLTGNKLSPLDRLRRLAGKIDVGGTLPVPKFNTSTQNINEVTRVPSKMNIQLQCLPVVTRDTISNQFSLKRYATGELMRGSTNNTGGGVW